MCSGVSNSTDKHHSELLDCIKHGQKSEQRSFVFNMDLLPSLALLIVLIFGTVSVTNIPHLP